MSDYLTSMARLSRGEAPVVTPRLPGLSAPAEEAGPIEAGGTAVQPQSGIEYPAGLTQPHPVAAVAPERSQLEPSAGVHATGPRPPEAGAETAMMRNGTVRPIKEPPTPPVAEQYTGRAGPATAAASSPGKDQPELSRTHPETAGKQVPLADRQHTTMPEQGQSSFSAPPVPTGQPARVMPVATRPLAPGHVQLQAAQQQLIAGLPASELTDSRRAAVHINIGRVEVRAQAAAPQPSPRPARPGQEATFSLSEYLKRSGGSS